MFKVLYSFFGDKFNVYTFGKLSCKNRNNIRKGVPSYLVFYQINYPLIKIPYKIKHFGK